MSIVEIILSVLARTVSKSIFPVEDNIFLKKFFFHEDAEKSICKGRKFWRCVFISCRFDFCRMENVSFIQCRFYHCTFEHTHIDGSSFDRCTFNDCRGDHVEGNHSKWFQCKWEQVEMPYSIFRSSQFAMCRWKKVDVSSCDFQDSLWQKGTIRSSRGNNSDWTRARLEEVWWKGLSLSYAVFSHVAFDRAFICDSDLHYARFYECRTEELKTRRITAPDIEYFSYQFPILASSWNLSRRYILILALASFLLGSLLRRLF